MDGVLSRGTGTRMISLKMTIRSTTARFLTESVEWAAVSGMVELKLSWIDLVSRLISWTTWLEHGWYVIRDRGAIRKFSKEISWLVMIARGSGYITVDTQTSRIKKVPLLGKIELIQDPPPNHNPADPALHFPATIFAR